MIYHSLSPIFIVNELFSIHILVILKTVVKIGFSKIQSQF